MTCGRANSGHARFVLSITNAVEAPGWHTSCRFLNTFGVSSCTHPSAAFWMPTRRKLHPAGVIAAAATCILMQYSRFRLYRDVCVWRGGVHTWRLQSQDRITTIALEMFWRTHNCSPDVNWNTKVCSVMLCYFSSIYHILVTHFYTIIDNKIKNHDSHFYYILVLSDQ